MSDIAGAAASDETARLKPTPPAPISRADPNAGGADVDVTRAYSDVTGAGPEMNRVDRTAGSAGFDEHRPLLSPETDRISDRAAGSARSASAVALLTRTEGPKAPWMRQERPAPSLSLGPSERVYPTWTDPTARRASDVIGGPVGRHASVGRNRVLTPLRVCLAMAIFTLICGWLYKSACIQQTNAGGVHVLDQSGERPWITGCYNDVVPLYASHGLDRQKLPYTTEYDSQGTLIPYAEYPVITGYWMWGVSEVSKWYESLAAKIGLPIPLDVAAYFTVGAILLSLLYLLAVSSTLRMTGRRPWDTALMCLSPLLVIHAFTNWDLLAIGLTATAMLAWSKGRYREGRPWSMGMLGWPLASGVLIGLGTSAKLYPVLLLGPLLVLCLRAGRMTAWLAAAAGAVLTWLAINLPVMAVYPDGWYQFVKLNTSRVAEYDSWYSLFQSLSGSGVFNPPAGSPPDTPPTLLNNLSLLLFALACVGIAWFGLSVRRRPRFGQLAFLVVVAFLLTNKVWSPQYSLWLVPLAALALPRWRLLLAWQFVEAAVWILLMFTFDQDTSKGLSQYPFDVAAIVRDILLITIVVKVLREAVQPARDLIRSAGDDDPAGGVLAGADDRRRIPSLPDLFHRLRPSTAAAIAAPPADEAEAASQTPEPLGHGGADALVGAPEIMPAGQPDEGDRPAQGGGRTVELGR